MPSSSTDPVSLVPRTSKTSSRKQRPGFRPVAKSKKKSTAASAKKSSKTSSAATAVEKEIVDKSVPATDKTTAAEATTTETTKKAATATQQTKPAATQKSAPSQRSEELHVTFAADKNNKDGDNNSKSSSTRKRKTRASTRKSTAKTNNKKASSAASATPASPRRSSRKRKQSMPSSIQIGVTRKTTTSSSSDPQKELETETARQEKQQDAAVAAAASAVAAASSTTSTAIVAVSQDQDVLDRLGAENAQGPKLSAFCSEFKSEKKEKGGGKRRKKNQQNQNNNNNDDENAAAAAANPDIGAAGADMEEVAETNNEDTAAAAGQPAPAGVPVVQIVDGEIVLQESSLMLPTRRTVQEVEEEFQDNIVEEDAQLAIVQASYNSFLTKGDAAANGGKRGPTTWSVKDTEKFFVALRQLGTDFGSMEAYFDNKRTRRQLKQKYRKELRKNPRLIEELALNPKYKTEIDMSAFDVEVDPKRIEAFENEEPPPYEPTDVEEENQASEPEKASGDKGDDAEVELPGVSENMQNKDHAEGEMEMEEVVEDAIEERRAELEAAKAAAEAKAARKATAAPKKRAPRKRPNKKSTREKAAAPAAAAGPSPKVNRKASFDDMEIDGMGGFPDAEMEEPSMEDFFENQTFGAMEQEAQQPEATEPSAPSSEKDASQVPYVAKKKSATKSKRPKIRPSLRKKKK